MRAGWSILQSGIWNLIGVEFSLAVTESKASSVETRLLLCFLSFYICVLFVFLLLLFSLVFGRVPLKSAACEKRKFQCANEFHFGFLTMERDITGDRR